MKLYFANTSPYARKARIALRELSLLPKVEEVFQNPFEDSPALVASNPLKKVPCLITGEGQAIYDSPVICAYLSARSESKTLHPDGAARWPTLTGEALADGILDAAFALVMERRRPEEQRSDNWQARWQASIDRSVTALDSDLQAFHGEITIAQVALGAALGYLDFRLPDIEWRAGRNELADWFKAFAARPSMQDTQPPAS